MVGPTARGSGPGVLAALDAVPPKYFTRLALVLACVLTLQIYSSLPRQQEPGLAQQHHLKQQQQQQRRVAEAREAPYEKTALALWEELQARGGGLAGDSAALSTRRHQLLTQADVEGASMDHNMSISNPCLTTSDLLKRAFLQPLPEPFSAFGQHRFILRSGYRLSPRDFVAVGLQLLRSTRKRSDLELRSPQLGDCFWMGSDGRKIDGQFKAIYPGEHHELMYETALYFCRLDEPSTGRTGGSAIMIIDGDKVVMHSEGPKAPDNSRDPPYFLGFCSFPMYRTLNKEAVHNWLKYHHHYVGVEYFVMHDGDSVDAGLYEVLAPYVDAGVMEVVDIRGEFKYETKHNVLTLNDCLHRMASVAKWSLSLDFDEYLWAQPPTTVHDILKEHDGAPYVTFGSLWWSITLCRSPTGDMLERMVFHWPHYYCVGSENINYPTEKCLNFYGHRKYFVDPRKVEAVQVHRPIEPKEGGVDVDVNVLHHNHFQGLSRGDTQICTEPQEPKKSPEWWVEDTKLAEAWRAVKYKERPQRHRK